MAIRRAKHVVSKPSTSHDPNWLLIGHNPNGNETYVCQVTNCGKRVTVNANKREIPSLARH